MHCEDWQWKLEGRRVVKVMLYEHTTQKIFNIIIDYDN